MIVRDETLIIVSVCARESRNPITSKPGSGYRALTWEICYSAKNSWLTARLSTVSHFVESLRSVISSSLVCILPQIELHLVFLSKNLFHFVRKPKITLLPLSEWIYLHLPLLCSVTCQGFSDFLKKFLVWKVWLRSSERFVKNLLKTHDAAWQRGMKCLPPLMQVTVIDPREKFLTSPPRDSRRSWSTSLRFPATCKPIPSAIFKEYSQSVRSLDTQDQKGITSSAASHSLFHFRFTINLHCSLQYHLQRTRLYKQDMQKWLVTRLRNNILLLFLYSTAASEFIKDIPCDDSEW